MIKLTPVPRGKGPPNVRTGGTRTPFAILSITQIAVNYDRIVYMEPDLSGTKLRFDNWSDQSFLLVAETIDEIIAMGTQPGPPL